MFKELAPYLRQRAVLLTVTHLDEDQIRVNVIPQKLKDGENVALTTPVTITGSAEDLDRDLSATLVNFVSSHLQLRNTLDKAKEEMDAAAKKAQADARVKTKAAVSKEGAKPESGEGAAPSKSVPPAKPDTPKTASLFDEAEPSEPAIVRPNRDVEQDILDEIEVRDEEEFEEAA